MAKKDKRRKKKGHGKHIGCPTKTTHALQYLLVAAICITANLIEVKLGKKTKEKI